jgi:hypothetical protein
MELGLDITKLQNILKEKTDEDSDEDYDKVIIILFFLIRK